MYGLFSPFSRFTLDSPGLARHNTCGQLAGFSRPERKNMKTVRAIALLALICCPLLPSAAEPVTVALRDHGRALLNPGMGWTMHFYSNLTEHYGSKLEPSGYAGVVRGVFRRLSAASLGLPRAVGGGFPLVACRYARPALDFPRQEGGFPLHDLRKLAGVCDAALVEQAGAKMVRYTFPGSPAPDGAAADPVFDDPVYLAKLRNFLRAAGERYNGNPDVRLHRCRHLRALGRRAYADDAAPEAGRE